jgi:hypothetical protein
MTTFSFGKISALKNLHYWRFNIYELKKIGYEIGKLYYIF